LWSWASLFTFVTESTATSDLQHFEIGLEVPVYAAVHGREFVTRLTPPLSEWASVSLFSNDPSLTVLDFQIIAEIVRKLGEPFSSEFFDFFRQKLIVLG
jgi:hypothetical protein